MNGRVLSLLLAAVGLLGCTASDPAAERDAGAERIVVMAPAAAEMLEALGVSERIVGIGDYVTRPARLTSLPRLGAYDRPNVERLLALECDLLVTAEAQAAADAHRRLASLGVAVLALDTATFDGVFESIERLGAAVDRRQPADALLASMRSELDQIGRAARGVTPRRVLIVVGRDPLYVAGPGSHLDEMLRLLGDVNVAADAISPWARLSLEAALERRPEVIIDTSDNRDGADRGLTSGRWAAWPFLPAVADSRVHHVAPDLLAIPGVRLPAMTQRLARMVHPERFGAPRADDYVADDRSRNGGV